MYAKVYNNMIQIICIQKNIISNPTLKNGKIVPQTYSMHTPFPILFDILFNTI